MRRQTFYRELGSRIAAIRELLDAEEIIIRVRSHGLYSTNFQMEAKLSNTETVEVGQEQLGFETMMHEAEKYLHRETVLGVLRKPKNPRDDSWDALH